MSDMIAVLFGEETQGDPRNIRQRSNFSRGFDAAFAYNTGSTIGHLMYHHTKNEVAR